jgi:transposase-like protein
MSYAKYPKEMKKAVVSRIMSGEETIIDIGRDTGININTL